MKIYELIIERMNNETENMELKKHYVISNNKKSLFEELELKGIESGEVIAVNEKSQLFHEEDVVPHILESGMKAEHKTILIEILKHEKFI